MNPNRKYFSLSICLFFVCYFSFLKSNLFDLRILNNGNKTVVLGFDRHFEDRLTGLDQFEDLRHYVASLANSGIKVKFLIESLGLDSPRYRKVFTSDFEKFIRDKRFVSRNSLDSCQFGFLDLFGLDDFYSSFSHKENIELVSVEARNFDYSCDSEDVKKIVKYIRDLYNFYLSAAASRGEIKLHNIIENFSKKAFSDSFESYIGDTLKLCSSGNVGVEKTIRSLVDSTVLFEIFLKEEEVVNNSVYFVLTGGLHSVGIYNNLKSLGFKDYGTEPLELDINEHLDDFFDKNWTSFNSIQKLLTAFDSEYSVSSNYVFKKNQYRIYTGYCVIN